MHFSPLAVGTCSFPRVGSHSSFSTSQMVRLWCIGWNVPEGCLRSDFFLWDLSQWKSHAKLPAADLFPHPPTSSPDYPRAPRLSQEQAGPAAWASSKPPLLITEHRWKETQCKPKSLLCKPEIKARGKISLICLTRCTMHNVSQACHCKLQVKNGRKFKG